MKKQLLYLLFICAAANLKAQNWSATNLTSVTYLALTGSEVHNNEMYATVFNGFTGSLSKLNPNDTSWSAISTGSITVPRFLQSAGSRLYMSSVISGVYSLLYYTTDGGSTFTVDTAGLPHYSTGVQLIYSLQYFNGKLIVGMGGNGYYLKDTAAAAFHHIDVPTALTSTDPLTCLNDTLVAYDHTGTSALYVSGDYGTTWSLRTNNLPADYNPSLMISNNAGRLYSSGAWSGGTLYGLYYSDNLGISWTLSSEAAPFIYHNASGGQQQITSMYANGPTFYMALQNNRNSSAPDVVGTTSGLPALAYDTLGLPTNAAGGANGVKFLIYKGKLSMQMNVMDVYIKGGPNGIAEHTKPSNRITLYPNPAADHIYINDPAQPVYKLVTLMNPEGQVIWSASGKVNDIDVSSLSKGSYLLRFVENDTTIPEIHLFIKN